MKKLNKTASKYANFLRFFIIIALGILGTLITILMFSQLFTIGQMMFIKNLTNIPTKILDEIVTFFLFFEFSVMIVAALKHMGHTSLNFLMSLGITALLRNLITAHGEPMQILIHAVSILLLINSYLQTISINTISSYINFKFPAFNIKITVSVIKTKLIKTQFKNNSFCFSGF